MTINEIISSSLPINQDLLSLQNEVLSDNNKNQNVWDVLNSISEKIEKTESNIEKRIGLFLDAFKILPSYYHFLIPLFNYFKDGTLTESSKLLIFKHFSDFITGDYSYKVRSETEYVMWVEFFEDRDTVESSWKLLLGNKSRNEELAKFIRFAGPVPYHLKEDIYIKLLGDEKYHQDILDSLCYSAYDVYGDIDLVKSKKIFEKLKVDKNLHNYQLLQDKYKA